MTRAAALACLVATAGCGGPVSSSRDGDDAPDTATEPDAGDPSGDDDADGVDVVGPACTDDSDCIEDEACPSVGGCDSDPCTDDRCRSETCTYIELEGCTPGYGIEYSYSACCPLRTLVLDESGTCAFTIDGEGARACDDVSPSFVTSIVEQASLAGFFSWGAEHCVPSSMGADFALRVTDGSRDNTVTCEAGACVGELCTLIDSIWAIMPSNWHDGCGCP
jgi:hypothetical protein